LARQDAFIKLLFLLTVAYEIHYRKLFGRMTILFFLRRLKKEISRHLTDLSSGIKSFFTF